MYIYIYIYIELENLAISYNYLITAATTDHVDFEVRSSDEVLLVLGVGDVLKDVSEGVWNNSAHLEVVLLS